MTLKEGLMDDLREAIHHGDVVRKNVIRMVRAAVANAEIEWQRPATDDEILALINKEIRTSQESLAFFAQGNRQDLVAEEEAKIAILEQYLPEQLTDKEVTQAVQQVIVDLAANGLGSLGPVMREAMASLKGRADGHRVNQIARELLGE